MEVLAVFDLRESIGDGEPVTQPLQLAVCSCTELDATYAPGNLQDIPFWGNYLVVIWRTNVSEQDMDPLHVVSGVLDCVLDFILVRSAGPHEGNDVQYKLQSQW